MLPFVVEYGLSSNSNLGDRENQSHFDARLGTNIGLLWLAVAFMGLFGCGGSTETDTPTRAQASRLEDSTTETHKELPDLSFGSSSDLSASASVKQQVSLPAQVVNLPDEPPKLAGKEGPQADDGLLPERRLGPLELVAVDNERLAAAGLTVVESKHLRLIYEPASQTLVADFPSAFDQAVQQWIEFFEADPQRFRNWKVTCFFIVDIEKFRAAKLIPDDRFLPGGKLPPGGWEFGNQIWVNRHPGEYYNRHMLLHEGTHAFCFFNYGNLGPPWLAEGLAEHLAVHTWKDSTLKLAARVAEKNELEYWGRVKIIQDAWFDGQPKSLGDVMKFEPQDFPATESYAWSWAAVLMFDRHSQLNSAFKATLKQLSELSTDQWNRSLLDRCVLNNNQLKSQWEVMISEMTYGYDLRRAEIQWSDQEENATGSFSVEVLASGAWKETGFELPVGKWAATTDGMFQIARENGQPLISTSDGISVQYFGGARIGELQAAIDTPDGFFQSSSKLTAPLRLSDSRILDVTEPGKLFLRINDHPSFLDDNDGQLTVVFSPVED